MAAIFALGFFVLIASIIRAYYSKLNETVLTCTVSMVETAVAIIATSLPGASPPLMSFQIVIMDQFPSSQHSELYSQAMFPKLVPLPLVATTNSRLIVVQGALIVVTVPAHISQAEQRKQVSRRLSLSRKMHRYWPLSAPSKMSDILLRNAKGGITLTTEYQVYQEDEEAGRRMRAL